MMRVSEHDEQAALIRWADWQQRIYPELALLFAIPNGGHRHKAVAQKLRLERGKAGLPDLCLPVARGGYHALFLELKVASGRLSRAQAAWLRALRRAGNNAQVVFGQDQARAVLIQYVLGRLRAANPVGHVEATERAVPGLLDEKEDETHECG
jgi:hypothetical protein